MHWIVEQGTGEEDVDPLLWIATGRRAGSGDAGRLVQVLKERGVPHDVVLKAPFADYLVSTQRDDATGDDVPLEIRPDEPVFAYGMTAIATVSQRSGWSPGYVDAPEMLEAIGRWGRHMLNHDVRIAGLGAMTPPQGTFFVRPDADGKAFPGTVCHHDDFEDLRTRLLDPKGPSALPEDTRVLCCPVRRILAEWRLAVVAGRVAASSRYRLEGRLDIAQGAPEAVIAYAHARVGEWCPRQAFVMDVCEIDDGYRIVETNSISSAGLYAMDIGTYVEAIERGLTE